MKNLCEELLLTPKECDLTKEHYLNYICKRALFVREHGKEPGLLNLLQKVNTYFQKSYVVCSKNKDCGLSFCDYVIEIIGKGGSTSKVGFKKNGDSIFGADLPYKNLSLEASKFLKKLFKNHKFQILENNGESYVLVPKENENDSTQIQS